jgi:CheY-like chemotaxis protein
MPCFLSGVYTIKENKKRENIMKTNNTRVLIVDDVRLNFDVIKNILNSYEIKCSYAINGQMAVDAVRDGKVIYNAIFIDQMMPDMDGMETARQIRQIDTEYAKTVPLIAISADTGLGGKDLNNEFQDFMTKPISIPEIDAIIRRWVLPDGEVSGNE